LTAVASIYKSAGNNMLLQTRPTLQLLAFLMLKKFLL